MVAALMDAASLALLVEGGIFLTLAIGLRLGRRTDKVRS